VALKFTLLGTPITIGLDFFVMALVIGLLQNQPDLLAVWVGIVFASVLLHELGHAAAFEAFGSRTAIRLYWAGGLTMGMKVRSRQHIVVSFAGPAMGILVGAFAGIAMLMAPRLQTNPVAQYVLWVNLGWALFNLLPFPGLDGGSILTEIATIVMGRPAEMIGRLLGILVIGAVTVVLVMAGQGRWAPSIVVLAFFSFVRLGVVSDVLVGKQPSVSVPELLNAGRFEDAFNLARSKIAARPQDPEPLIWASDALRQMTRYDDAELGYDNVLARDPRNPRALRGRAAARRLMGRLDGAEADLRELLAVPDGMATFSKAAGLYDADRHLDGYNLVTAVGPLLQEAGLARVFGWLTPMFEYTLGRETDALRDVERALRDSPDEQNLHEQRALILCDLGRFAEARASARKALDASPRHPEFHQTMGLVTRMGGDPRAGLDHLMTAAVALPNGARARGELIACYVQLGKEREADAALRTLPGYAAADPFVVYARAAMAAAAGAEAQALELIGQAAAIRPELRVRAAVDPLFASGRLPELLRQSLEITLTGERR